MNKTWVFAAPVASVLALGLVSSAASGCSAFSGTEQSGEDAGADTSTLPPPPDAAPADGGTDAPVEGGPCNPDSPPLDDPKNCGACAHDCAGGTCSDGLCQPTVVASGLDRPFSIVADEDGVYFTTLGPTGTTTNGALRACESSPCTPSLLGAASLEAPTLLAMTPDALFVAPEVATDAPSASMRGYKRSDHSVLPTFPFGAYGPIGLFAPAGAKEVYFVDRGSASSGFGKGINKLLPGTGTYSYDSTVSVSNTNANGRVVVASGKVLSTSPTFDAIYETSNANSRVSGHAIVDLATDGTDIAWLTTHTAAPSVWRCATGCSVAPAQIGLSAAKPRGLALDASGIYWTSEGATKTSGRIEWIRAGTNDAPKVIVKNLPQPQRIAVTKKYLYFTTFGGSGTAAALGTVMRLAKPL